MAVVTIPTQEEIRQRFLERKEKDLLGFEVYEYLDYCGFDWVKENVGFNEKTEFTEEMKADFSKPIDRESIINKMKDYMSFAFEKANNHRGISASRSIMHYVAWTWLAGDRDFSNEIDRDYYDYGKSILREICKFYSWGWDQWDV